MNYRVLATARALWATGQSAMELLEREGIEVVMAPKAGPIAEAELIPLLQGCHAVIALSDPYNERVFAACPELQIVSRCGVGTDAVDMVAATAAGVIATNAPGTMTEAVADYTLALMLGVARGIPEGDAMMKSGGWGESPGVLVWEKTLGLVGFGQIGQAVARRAHGFRMRIIAFDPIQAQRDASEFDVPVEFVSLEELLAQSDFVSVHAPRTPETENLMDADRIGQMKSSAYLVNTARGGLIHDQALIEALEKGTIAGAAIDVYRQEPLPADSLLRKAPRMLLTPHNAFNARESAEEMSRVSALNVVTLLRGEGSPFVCNPDVWQSPNLRLVTTPR